MYVRSGWKRFVICIILKKMNNRQNTYQQQIPGLGIPPQGSMMPPQIPMQNRAPRGWRERWMHRFGMDTAAAPLRKRELTIPNWLIGSSIAFFFVAMFACWGAFGYVPAFGLWMVAAISVVLFFYGGSVMSKNWSHAGEKRFIRNVFVAGFVIRLLWVLYVWFFFNIDHYGAQYGERADVEWYMPFAHDLAKWITGDSPFTFAQIV